LEAILFGCLDVIWMIANQRNAAIPGNEPLIYRAPGCYSSELRSSGSMLGERTDRKALAETRQFHLFPTNLA
jgi:hypothetical protein